VAAFLIDSLADTLEALDNASLRITRAVSGIMERERLRINSIEQYLANAFAVRKVRIESKLADYAMRMKNAIGRRMLVENNRINNISTRMPYAINALTQRERHTLQMFEQRTKALDPINILRRGYSITLHNGKAVTDGSLLNENDDVTVVFANGKRKMKVLKS
jgi:exodeoxyribonuclease VII large subunit